MIDTIRSLALMVVLVACIVVLEPGCGGGSGPRIETVPEILVADDLSDEDGVSVLLLGDEQHTVIIEDEETQEPLPGLRVVGASDESGGAVFVIDELGAYPAVVVPLSTLPTLRTGASSTHASGDGAQSLDLYTLIRLPSVNSLLTFPSSFVKDAVIVSKAVLAKLYETVRDRGFGYSWNRRVPLSDLEHDMGEHVADAGVEYVASTLAEEAVGTSASPLVALVTTAVSTIKTVGETIVYSGYIHRCYSPSTMVRLFQVGPITLFVWPEGGPAVTPPGDDISLSGVVRDGSTGALLPDVSIRFWPAGESTLSDARGSYELEDVEIGCSLLNHLYIRAEKAGYETATFFADQQNWVPDAANDFDFSLQPMVDPSALVIPRVAAPAVTIDGNVGALEWSPSWYSSEMFPSGAGDADVPCVVHAMHDGSFVYVALETPLPDGGDAKARLRFDGDNSGMLDGSSTYPYRDISTEKGAPGAAGLYTNYLALTDSTAYVHAPPGGGESKASSRTASGVSYEFKVPLADLTASAGDTIRLVITVSSDGYDMWYWPVVDAPDPAGGYVPVHPTLWRECLLQP